MRGAWRLLVPIGILALTLALPAPVAAASLTLDPASGPVGATANAIGSDYPMHTEILILWDGVPLKRPANSGNASPFRIEFHVPTSATTGPHVVTMCVKGASANACGSPSDDATFTVLPPATPTPIPTPTPSPSPSPTPSPTPSPSPSPTPSPTPIPTPTPFPTPAATPDLARPSAGPAVPPSSLRLVLAAEAVVVLGAGLYLVRARRTAVDAGPADEPGASQPRG